MARGAMRRAGLVAVGLVLGLLLILIGMGIYLRASQIQQAQSAIGREMRLPEDVLRVEDVSVDGLVRIALRRVAVLDEQGDTIVAAPLARLWLDPGSLSGTGPIVFRDVELVSPLARIIQDADGEWNVIGAMRLEADGQDVQLAGGEEEGRPIHLLDVRIRDGRMLLAMPAAAPDTAGFASRLSLPVARFGGAWYQLYSMDGVEARLPLVRIGGAEGWRAEVVTLDARLAEPELRITGLQGFAEAVGEDGVRFDMDVLRFGESRVAAEGLVRFPEDESALIWDVQAQVPQLAFSDLSRLIPGLPTGGTAQFALDVESGADGRTALTVSELQVVALDSRVAGQLGVVFGGESVPVFRDTRLSLDPLRLAALEQLGLVEEMPLLGEIRGTLATTGADADEGLLTVDLAASLVPRDPSQSQPSRINAVGALALQAGDAPLRLQGLRIELQPLYLASLASMLPEQRERLRGELRGALTLTGTPRDLTAEGGELVYRIGSVPETRFVGVGGTLTLDPALRYSFEATAQPLSLASLTEIFPALPFRTATLSGPIRFDGTSEEARFALSLSGGAGAIRLAGSAEMGTPLRFDVDGRVETFAASAILRNELPVEGPVSGTFAANGTAEDFRFNVDLAQTAGKFALAGRVRLPGGPPIVDVGGQVENFRLGAVISQPGLFASPLSGTLQVAGGGTQAYRFDVDLRGDVGVFDLEGFFNPGDVPSYSARGNVAGLDVHRLPFGSALPHTNLVATLDLEGQGTTLETLSGTLALDARRSMVAGIPLDVARARLAVQGGVLRVDTLAVQMRDARFSAHGMWGLTTPAPQPLEFLLDSPNLATLSRLISTSQIVQPQVAGALRLEGSVGGSLQNPIILAGMRGRRLRFEEWQADDLTLALEATRSPEIGWGGELSLGGEGLLLAGGQQLQSVRLQMDGNQTALAVGLFARRDAQSEVSVSGILEFEGQVPRGVVLDSLSVRVADARWSLLNQARVQWGGVAGLRVDGLALQRSGAQAGLILVDGQLPPTGDASLRVQANGVDLADVRRLAGESLPEMAGQFTLDALLEGPVTSPDFTLLAGVEGLRFGEVAADRIQLRGEYIAQRLETTAEIWMGGRQVAEAEGGIPMVLAVENLIPRIELLDEAPLRAVIRADSLPVELASAFAPQLENGTGVASAQIRVGGTLDVPQLDGWARLRDASVSVVPMGVRYTGINGAVTLTGNTVRIDSLAAHSGGTAELDGTVRFEAGAGPQVYLAASMNGFRVMDVEDQATVTTSGRIALAGPLPRPVLNGRLVLQETTITIPNLEDRSTVEITDVEVGQVGTDSLATAAFLPAFLADLRVEGLEVEVGESVWLVSDEARIQIDGDLVLYRTGDELRVFGLLQAVRGTYALEIGSIIRQFDIVSGRVQFFGTGDLNPSLEIVAANRVRTGGVGTGSEITILVNISGTLQSPRIRLTSDTPTALSETELFSLLIFGRPSFQLGGLGAAFAQQIFVQELLGGILATELGRPILASGLCDYVRVQPGLTSLSGLVPSQGGGVMNTLNAAAIECGKEISDELFLTVETGLGGLFAGDPLSGGGAAFNWGIGLEWQIDPEWMWELSYGPVRRSPLLRLVNPLTTYQLSTDLRRRWEYGKPTRRAPLEGGPPNPLLGEVAPRREDGTGTVRRQRDDVR